MRTRSVDLSVADPGNKNGIDVELGAAPSFLLGRSKVTLAVSVDLLTFGGAMREDNGTDKNKARLVGLIGIGLTY